MRKSREHDHYNNRRSAHATLARASLENKEVLAVFDHLPSASDASAPKGTRGWLVKRGAVGALGIAAASAVIPTGDALASAQDERAPRDSSHQWGVFASTTEALTVTILTELLRRAGVNSVPSSVSTIFDGVYAAELDHWNFTRQHWNPSTTQFWIPDGFFGGSGDALDLTTVGKGVAAGEHVFVNTYLLGVTILAHEGRPTLARYAAELAGDESEHRVLGEFLAGSSPPNNLGFEVFEFSSVKDLEGALAGAGFGLGQQGSAPGRFYELPNPPIAPPVAIGGNTPT